MIWFLIPPSSIFLLFTFRNKKWARIIRVKFFEILFSKLWNLSPAIYYLKIYVYYFIVVHDSNSLAVVPYRPYLSGIDLHSDETILFFFLKLSERKRRKIRTWENIFFFSNIVSMKSNTLLRLLSIWQKKRKIHFQRIQDSSHRIPL